MRYLVAVLLVLTLSLAACGDDDGDNGGGGGGGGGSAGGGCLTANEVQREVDKIAGGIEASQDEVEAKQQAIQDVRDREC